MRLSEPTKESQTDYPRHNSNRDSPFDKVHTSIVATNSTLDVA